MLKMSTLVLPLFFLLALLSACEDTYEGDFSYSVQDFEFTNQNGEKISKNDLEGNFWIADFIFTNCETVCPPMTANMVQLQKTLKEEGLDDVKIASFSVDPENDTPEKLKEYVLSRGGTLDNWQLFTGYDFQTIKEFAIKCFKAPVEELADDDQVMHIVSFYIVTPEGNAIKRYNGTQPAEIDKIVEDLQNMH